MATINDVAREAGLTVTTVSRVLNNRGYISEATRTKVHRVMAELDYQPNEIARSLYRQRSKMLGLIVPTVSHPFFGELSSSIEQQAYEAGYKIVLCNSHLDQEKEREYVNMLKRHKVDGIIMGSHTLRVDEYENLNMPIVTIDRQISDSIPALSSDNYEGGRLAAKLLLSRGCRNVAHICGSLKLELFANLRHDAFIQEMARAGVSCVVVQTNIDVFDTTQYEALVNTLFSEHPETDGVFASDLKAARVIQACVRLGKRVPDDVRIVGYDDVKLASLLVPALTTVHQPIDEMARQLVQLMLRQIAGESVPMRTVLPVTLVERHST
ncbi:MAG TPA: LacI family DNA-binding transcriptional regulator [Spirochaetia bacterium]|nr:LacI family DNA-binding transcriptional regulator [Spirochaetia bacterium]